MKRIALGLLAALVLSAGSAAAKGVFYAGTELQKLCNTPEADNLYYVNSASCRHYVVGVADTFSCDEPFHGFGWQSGSNMSASQMQQVVKRWLNDHPADLHYAAVSLVVEALSEAFPCS